MDLTVLGCSPAIQNPGGACSSYLISEGESHILADCGHGSVGVLRSVTEVSQLSAVVISHMHPDHIFDLVPLTYGFMFDRAPAIPLLLPPDGYGVLQALQSAVGLTETFFADRFQIRPYDPAESVVLAGIRLDFAPTQHYIPANAMRFTSPRTGRSLVYSADTGWTDSVVQLMRGAALAVIEASVPEYHDDNEAFGHLTPRDAGRMAHEAGVDRLMLTHYARANASVTRTEAEKSLGAAVDLAHEGGRYRV